MLVSVTLFALFGADPVLTVFTLPAAPGTLGIVVLMATVSGAAPRHFLRKLERSDVRVAEDLWRDGRLSLVVVKPRSQS